MNKLYLVVGLNFLAFLYNTALVVNNHNFVNVVCGVVSLLTVFWLLLVAEDVYYEQ